MFLKPTKEKSILLRRLELKDGIWFYKNKSFPQIRKGDSLNAFIFAYRRKIGVEPEINAL